MGGEFNRAGSGTNQSRVIDTALPEEQGAIFIDLLVALCLSLVIIGMLQQLAGLVYAAHIDNADQAELQYSARMALNCIQRDIRCARDFQVSPDGSKLTITDTEGKSILIFVQNHNLYRKDVSSIPVAENLTAVHFHKSAAALQGKLELQVSKSNYCLDFYCYARSLQAQDEELQ